MNVQIQLAASGFPIQGPTGNFIVFKNFDFSLIGFIVLLIMIVQMIVVYGLCIL